MVNMISHAESPVNALCLPFGKQIGLEVLTAKGRINKGIEPVLATS